MYNAEFVFCKDCSVSCTLLVGTLLQEHTFDKLHVSSIREDANSHWLHLFDFSPLCILKCKPCIISCILYVGTLLQEHTFTKLHALLSLILSPMTPNLGLQVFHCVALFHKYQVSKILLADVILRILSLTCTSFLCPNSNCVTCIYDVESGISDTDIYMFLSQ